MKKLLRLSVLSTLAFAMCIFVGCSSMDGLTHQERKGQRKLKKALQADPNILTKYTLDTILTGELNADVIIMAEGFDGETPSFNCDSLQDALKRKAAANDNSGVYLHQDSLIDISVKEDSKGNLKVQYVVKDRLIRDTVKVPYEIPVAVDGAAFKIYVPQPFWRSPWFWLMAAYSVLMTYLWIAGVVKRRKRDEDTIIINSTGKDETSDNK